MHFRTSTLIQFPNPNPNLNPITRCESVLAPLIFSSLSIWFLVHTQKRHRPVTAWYRYECWQWHQCWYRLHVSHHSCYRGRYIILFRPDGINVTDLISVLFRACVFPCVDIVQCEPALQLFTGLRLEIKVKTSRRCQFLIGLWLENKVGGSTHWI